jgi:hypothetical protein
MRGANPKVDGPRLGEAVTLNVSDTNAKTIILVTIFGSVILMVIWISRRKIGFT